MYVPPSPLLKLVTVGQNYDAADQYIAANASPGDLVITSDIILASELVGKGVSVISSSGKAYTRDNVKEAHAMRDLMQQLREGRLIHGGPPPFGAKEVANFANALDRELTRLAREMPKPKLE